MADGESHVILNQLGERLRAVRHSRELTLSQVADRAGVTTGFLSQLERGRNSPSLMTLHRVAEALGMPLRDLFGSEESPGAPQFIVRHHERQQLKIPGVKQVLYSLTPETRPNDALGFEALLNVLPPGVSTTEAPTGHAGAEWFYVLSGTVQLQVNSAVYTLGPHDSAAFVSGVPHRVTNTGETEAEVIWVNAPKQFT